MASDIIPRKEVFYIGVHLSEILLYKFCTGTFRYSAGGGFTGSDAVRLQEQDGQHSHLSVSGERNTRKASLGLTKSQKC